MVAVCDLEGSAVSFADLVQLILERVDLPVHFLEGQAFRSDEQAAIFSPSAAQKGNLHACPIVPRLSGWRRQLTVLVRWLR